MRITCPGAPRDAAVLLGLTACFTLAAARASAGDALGLAPPDFDDAVADFVIDAKGWANSDSTVFFAKVLVPPRAP